MVSPVTKSVSIIASTAFAISPSPPQRPSGVARSTLANSSSDVPSGAAIGPGAIALTEALALELASDNILVNAIAPGPIVAPPGTTEEEQRAVEAATPLGRWGGPEAIVRAVVFLLETDFVTGETIRVDGGRHVK